MNLLDLAAINAALQRRVDAIDELLKLRRHLRNVDLSALRAERDEKEGQIRRNHQLMSRGRL